MHPITVLALWHFTLQSKADVTEPMLMAGLYAWLVGYRLIAPEGGAPGVLALLGLAVGAALAGAGFHVEDLAELRLANVPVVNWTLVGSSRP